MEKEAVTRPGRLVLNTSVIIGLATASSPIPPVQSRAEVENSSQNCTAGTAITTMEQKANIRATDLWGAGCEVDMDARCGGRRGGGACGGDGRAVERKTAGEDDGGVGEAEGEVGRGEAGAAAAHYVVSLRQAGPGQLRHLCRASPHHLYRGAAHLVA